MNENMPQFNDGDDDLPTWSPFESQLRGVELPATGIDRDQLMYQSGWVAAVAALEAKTGTTAADSNSHEWKGPVGQAGPMETPPSPWLRSEKRLAIWQSWAGVSTAAAILFAVMFSMANSGGTRTDSREVGSRALAEQKSVESLDDQATHSSGRDRNHPAAADPALPVASRGVAFDSDVPESTYLAQQYPRFRHLPLRVSMTPSLARASSGVPVRLLEQLWDREPSRLQPIDRDVDVSELGSTRTTSNRYALMRELLGPE